MLVEHLDALVYEDASDNNLNKQRPYNENSTHEKAPLMPYKVPLCFAPNVFRQANLDAFTNIVQRIRDRIYALGKQTQKKLPNCLEFYGGVSQRIVVVNNLCCRNDLICAFVHVISCLVLMNICFIMLLDLNIWKMQQQCMGPKHAHKPRL